MFILIDIRYKNVMWIGILHYSVDLCSNVLTTG